MLKSEFERLTRIFLPQEMFHFIYAKYMDMEVDKQEFCRMYKDNTDDFAEKIQMEYEKAVREERKEFLSKIKKEAEEADAQISNLEKQVHSIAKALEKEQEWEDYYPEKMYAQEEYSKLVNEEDEMSVGDAKKFISESFGFMPEAVEILTQYPVQQINRHGSIRNIPGKFFTRTPMYYSTDYNYILFQCMGYLYECVDGELYLLED